MVQWEAVKKVTVTEQIMEQIAQFITQGELKPGDQLPNERELALQLGVTRGRVREALRALSLVGLITIKAGEGSFVNQQETPISADTIVWMFHNEIHNLEEIFAARRLIESEVFIAAAPHLKEIHLRQLSVILEKLTAHAQVEPPTILALLDAFDLLIGEHCGNAIYYKLMQTIVHLRRETSLKILQVPGAKENSIQCRSAILDALRTGQTEAIQIAASAFYTASESFYHAIASE